MARCAVCGRTSDEVVWSGHCPRCHQVHDRLKREPLWALDQKGSGATSTGETETTHTGQSE